MILSAVGLSVENMSGGMAHIQRSFSAPLRNRRSTSSDDEEDIELGAQFRQTRALSDLPGCRLFVPWVAGSGKA